MCEHQAAFRGIPPRLTQTLTFPESPPTYPDVFGMTFLHPQNICGNVGNDLLSYLDPSSDSPLFSREPHDQNLKIQILDFLVLLSHRKSLQPISRVTTNYLALKLD